jgi:hypothetical protein
MRMTGDVCLPSLVHERVENIDGGGGGGGCGCGGGRWGSEQFQLLETSLLIKCW